MNTLIGPIYPVVTVVGYSLADATNPVQSGSNLIWKLLYCAFIVKNKASIDDATLNNKEEVKEGYWVWDKHSFSAFFPGDLGSQWRRVTNISKTSFQLYNVYETVLLRLGMHRILVCLFSYYSMVLWGHRSCHNESIFYSGYNFG